MESSIIAAAHVDISRMIRREEDEQKKIKKLTKVPPESCKIKQVWSRYLKTFSNFIC